MLHMNYPKDSTCKVLIFCFYVIYEAYWSFPNDAAIQSIVSINLKAHGKKHLYTVYIMLNKTHSYRAKQGMAN